MTFLSLVSYTYNDASLLRRLLAGVPALRPRPDEIVVVDDGSAEPFVPPADSPPLKLIRHSENRGFAAAKGAAINAAAGEHILAVDCDMLLAPDWPARCLARLEDPRVALVGGVVVPPQGRDLVSRYQAVFDSFQRLESGEAEFISGNAFLLRREAWEAVGGFGDMRVPYCEDHALCRKLRDAGHTLFFETTARGVQARRLARPTFCRRVWTWCRGPILTACAKADHPTEPIYGYLIEPMQQRFEPIIDRAEPLFIYLELLYLAYAGVDLLRTGQERGYWTEQATLGFHQGLNAILAPHPALNRLLRLDLKRAGVSLPQTESEPRPSPTSPQTPIDEPWPHILQWRELLEDSGLLAWLNAQGVPELLREDGEAEWDFSWYGL